MDTIVVIISFAIQTVGIDVVADLMPHICLAIIDLMIGLKLIEVEHCVANGQDTPVLLKPSPALDIEGHFNLIIFMIKLARVLVGFRFDVDF